MHPKFDAVRSALTSPALRARTLRSHALSLSAATGSVLALAAITATAGQHPSRVPEPVPSRAAAHSPLASPSASPAPAAPTAAAPAKTAAPAKRASRATRASRPARSWVAPMRGSVSSGFGYRWGSMHAGLDLVNGSGGGSPVFAAAAGTVKEARCTSPDCSHRGGLSMPGYGNKVDIAHPGGVMTRYGHLVKFVVSPGQRVKAGELVGFEGATGNVTGPHLHFEVHVGGSAVDPAPYLRAHGVRVG